MTRFLRLLASVWPVLATACTHIPLPPPGPVEPPTAAEACEAFCEVRVQLQCEATPDSPGTDEIDGTADDEPCEVVCRDIVTLGRYTPDRACLDSARSCGEADACMFGPELRDGAPAAPGLPPVAPDGPGAGHMPPTAWRPVRSPMYLRRGQKWRRAAGQWWT